MPQYPTVGRLIAKLQKLDPTLQVRLGVNPDWPFANSIGPGIIIRAGRLQVGDEEHKPGRDASRFRSRVLRDGRRPAPPRWIVAVLRAHWHGNEHTDLDRQTAEQSP